MTDNDLYEIVKGGLGVGSDDPAQLKTKTTAVKQYLINAGISQERIFTELGAALVTIGVTDLWNLSAGEISFSPAFNLMLMQLQAMTAVDEAEAEATTTV